MKRRYFVASGLLVALCVLCLFGAYNLHMVLSGGVCSMNLLAVLAGIQIRNVRLFWYMGCAGSLLAVVWMMVSRSYIKYQSDMQKITPDIEVPKAEGQGQYGTARWLDPKRFSQVFSVAQVQNLSKLQEGGIVLGQSKDGKHIYYTGEDTHAFVIGATRSGKSRTVVLPTIGLLSMAGESMVTVDPKAELYTYTYPFLEAQGYEVITIDFDSPGKSNRYNFLQPVIDAVNAENVALAVTKARDISAMLVQDSGHTDPLWPNGQRSVLTASILAVVVDNQRHPEFQNLANAQQFMVNMCKPFGKNGDIPLAKYLQTCPPEHPARIAMGTAEIAPSKMRGSFYTSAATTLDLFTDPAIHAMTAETDWDIYATGQRKRAIFIILPDERSTYYPLAALFVYQHYQTLVGVSKTHGNRLPHRVNFNCDEFGNFVKIPDFDKLITVGGGRGIRFNLLLQDVNQLDEKYGDKLGKVIRSNCETWIYLQSDDEGTLKELSGKLGKYTIKTPSLSGSTGGNLSSSYNLTGRDLLDAAEIKKINRPYQLVTSRNDPAILYAPDVSKTIWNELFGLGSKEHNRKLIIARSSARPERTPDVHYWKIWDLYIKAIQMAQSNEKEK